MKTLPASLRGGLPALRTRAARRNLLSLSSRAVAVEVPRQFRAFSNVTVTPSDLQKVPKPLQPSDTFMKRHIGPDEAEIDEMCQVIGVKDLDDLIKKTVPADIFRDTEMKIHWETQSETMATNRLRAIGQKNKVFKSYIGMGYHNTILPAVIERNLFENPSWYTAYTPYQAEISQGRLESLLNFQTMVTELTGMEVANASLLDEGTAAAEAMTLAFRATGANQNKNVFFISEAAHPQTIDVMKTRASHMGMQVIVGDHHEFNFKKQKLCGALLQYPDTYGRVEDLRQISEDLHSVGAQMVVATDLLALTLITPPGEFGADVAIGSSQRFGVPMGFGGPHAAFFSTSKENMRRMPGRIIGMSIDPSGDKALRMAMQTREQHIRKDKATSNVCTAQALLANVAAMYGIYHGPQGLKAIAQRTRGLTAVLSEGLMEMGYSTANGDFFFDTLTVDIAPISTDRVREIMTSRMINVRYLGPTSVGVSLDETTTYDDVKELLEAFSVAKTGSISYKMPSGEPNMEMPEPVKRATPFMTQQIFNLIQTETEMMRYMKYLENKDLALNTSMITLGSCTMKLNPASTLHPILWNNFANMHPFAPAEQTAGYRQLIFELCDYLCTITGFHAVSLQPNSGASGEYAGLLAIRQYLDSIGEGHRDVCIIPKSAHGTNPASAVMCGMRIKAIDSDAKGNIDLEQLKQVAADNNENLAALMVTYPSTMGIFDPNIRAICETIHQHGGQVYMDGANMNAQVGLTSPALIGADVCHLNLHKTFAIPHGGGGPGVGPIGVRKHLAPFLPTHGVIKINREVRGGAVSAAPYGSAMILPISWMFIHMLGGEGLTRSTEIAILNANYMMERLRPHFEIKFGGEHGRCAHEFILDLSKFKPVGIVEEDVAKRLIDFGFHAPTMSWPVPGALMIEPTESENKGELDRFCDAMILIREEIGKIEKGEWPQDDNPLKRAPHTQKDVMSEDWNRPYTRNQAAFPAPWVWKRGKFWPSVGRVNNPYGEKHLVCECGDVADYTA